MLETSCDTCDALVALVIDDNVTGLTFVMILLLQSLIGCAIVALWVFAVRDFRHTNSDTSSDEAYSVGKIIPVEQVLTHSDFGSSSPLHQTPLLSASEGGLLEGFESESEASWKFDGYQAKDVVRAAAEVCG